MLTRKEIKDIQSLTQKKSRDELNLFVVEGVKSVRELVIGRPDLIVHVYGVEGTLMSEFSHLPHTRINEVELARISHHRSPNEILAVARKIDWKVPVAGKVIYLENIQDPGNLGTIIRTADWFGLDAVVCSSTTVDVYNSKVVQASMASIFRMPVFYDENYEWLKAQTTEVLTATMDGESYHGIKRLEKGILIIGNEGKGVSVHLRSTFPQTIAIPRTGEAESLNAAVAAGILMSAIF